MPSAKDFHHNLLDLIIARGSLWSRPLIAAFRATPRLYFLDRLWDPREGRWRLVSLDHPDLEDLEIIYSDRAITTRLSSPAPGEHPVALSSSSQPSLMAQMLEDLDLSPGLRVLEIGTGTGYNAALLAHVVGRVLSIDVDQHVLEDARRHLARLPDRQVLLFHADGRLGYAPSAPYDRIQVTAATDDLEPAWLDQLAQGGLLQAPLDFAPGLAWIVQGTVTEGRFLGSLTRAAFFMPLREEDDPGRDRNVPSGPVPDPEQLSPTRAPWADWSDVRIGGSAGFLPSLTFLGLLEGLTVAHSACPEGRSGFALADLVRGEVCWIGAHEWRVSGNAGHQLGLRLWRRWLDLGAPRPTEWRLRAIPQPTTLPASPSVRASYLRAGPRCLQRWELVEPRRRLDLD